MVDLISAAATLAFMAQSAAVLVEQIPSTTHPPAGDASKVFTQAAPTPAKLHRPSNGAADISLPNRCSTEATSAGRAERVCPRTATLAVPSRAASVERTLIESLGLRDASGARVRTNSDQQDAGALTADTGATLSDKSGQAAAILSAQAVTPAPPPGPR